MNNFPFMLAKAMRKRGYDVVFIIIEKEQLCRPEFRYKDISLPYPDWIRDYSEFDFNYFSNDDQEDKFKLLLNEFNDCKYLFLNGYAIRLSKYFRIKHFCVFTGSDLSTLADEEFAHKRFKDLIKNRTEKGELKMSIIYDLIGNRIIFNMAKYLLDTLNIKCNVQLAFFKPRNKIYNFYCLIKAKRAFLEKIKEQQDSIRNATGFYYAPEGLVLDGDILLKKIGVDNSRRIEGLMIDDELSEYSVPTRKNKIRIFNVARFNWVKSNAKEINYFSQLDLKSNDIMIKGIALFYKKHQVPLDIVFVKKGNDIKETIELTKECKIDSLITWKEVLTQSEVIEECKNADIIFDQLGNSAVAMGGLDAMAVGRPLIANARSEIFDVILKEKTQICDSKDEYDVLNWLEKLVFDEEFRIEKGKASRDFVLRHFTASAVIRRTEKYLKS